MRNREQHKVESRDLQTPVSLAREVCCLVAGTGFHPASILELTCETGPFLKASLATRC